ncbi:MAG: Asp-tRNA(Asn)/Glu-tRNA(Gln) amidotransferase subunit GatC, partial [Devosia sp.]
MSVDAATVKRIGRLARIRVEENEVEKYQGEINAILGFVEQLGEVDVTGIEPMTSVTPMQLRRRDDDLTPLNDHANRSIWPVRWSSI